MLCQNWIFITNVMVFLNKIISLSPNAKGIPDPAEQQYVGKTGIINYIDDAGTIWGTWGGIGLLPCDNYEVINKEGE